MHNVQAKGILSTKSGMNLYRGCSHNCIYCDSRSNCYQMTHDFEDIEVKENAIELLELALKRKRKKCMIGTGSMTDPYIPLEMQLGNVRKTIELVCEYGFGFTVITKSNLILRDLDLLKKINEQTKCIVQMTLTTYDEDLCKKLEPNVCTTRERVEVLKILRDNGIPTVVWLSPILPYINDTRENIEGILNYCIEAKVYGIICFGMGMTLRSGNREYFYRQLDKLFPNMKSCYQQAFGEQYILNSPKSIQLMSLYHSICEKNGIMHDNDALFAYLNEFEQKQRFEQLNFL